MKDIFETLKSRGLIAQESHPGKIAEVLKTKKINFYLGIDPTADSMHIGHLVPFITAARLVKAGHKAIFLFGGGTALIGDPSGKTEMRKMLTQKDITSNLSKLQKQVKNMVGTKNTSFVNNANWLKKLNYIDFLRNFGTIFKVNEMIKSESYRARLEREQGLSFLEFNYQILQGYDYFHLFKKKDCILQLGGDDQWSNMLAGVDLIKRTTGKEAYVLTMPLLTTASGKKMGKTEGGAVWLDPKKTSPYDFYQYWINVEDADVIRFMNIFTFVPEDEIEEMKKVSGADIRDLKKRLAFEVTSFIHGEKEADRARQTAEALFSGDVADDIPTVSAVYKEGDLLVDVMLVANVVMSKGEARKLIEQGGVTVNEDRITNPVFKMTGEHTDHFLLKIGKKKFYRVENR